MRQINSRSADVLDSPLHDTRLFPEHGRVSAGVGLDDQALSDAAGVDEGCEGAVEGRPGDDEVVGVGRAAVEGGRGAHEGLARAWVRTSRVVCGRMTDAVGSLDRSRGGRAITSGGLDGTARRGMTDAGRGSHMRRKRAHEGLARAGVGLEGRMSHRWPRSTLASSSSWLG